MARVEGPLHSFYARNSFGKMFTYFIREDVTFMREYIRPRIINTEEAIKYRSNFSQASKLAKELNQYDRQAWQLKCGKKEVLMTWQTKLTQVYINYREAGVNNFNLISQVEADSITAASASFTGRVTEKADFLIFWDRFTGKNSIKSRYPARTLDLKADEIIDNSFHFTLDNLNPGESYAFQIYQRPVLVFPPRSLNHEIVGTRGERSLEVIVALVSKYGDLMLDTSIRHRLDCCPDVLNSFNYLELHWPRVPEAEEYLIYLVEPEENRAYLAGKTTRNIFVLHQETPESTESISLKATENPEPYSTLNLNWAGESGIYQFTTGH